MNQTVKERYRIFLVEDDASIVDVLSRQLTRWNFDIYPIQDFENVLEEFYKCNPHLVLMDISLPFYDGYYWCHKIRQISKTPVVFLSSAGDDLNQVMALNMGADDFIVKPFRLEFAVAKIQAMLRRTYTFGKNSDILFCGSISLNLNEAVLSFNDQQIELSKNEFRLMQILMEASKTENYYTLWSHQIKTPLSAIRLLLQEDPVKRRQIDLELLKVEQYVDMALQYQRLDDHTKDLQIAQYDISNMVRQVIKKIAPLFIYKKIHLDLREFSQIVITDEKWTCFLIEQILTNAVKYTPEGGTISVFLDEAIPSCLIIKDTGIGILPEDLPRVFEWGYTGYNGRIQKRSTGIGLSLCKQVADLLGHTISIESKVRIGTTVRLDLSHPPLLTE